VGYYSANHWGFFDMHGNVWEWTADLYQAAYPSGNPVIDPIGPALGSSRVNRGGSWYVGGASLRSAKRGTTSPSDRYVSVGFRLCLQNSQ
jgi:formylglycine-generating enzyme required for sulfatase activity